jgi:predicted outer membrane repeat protein
MRSLLFSACFGVLSLAAPLRAAHHLFVDSSAPSGGDGSTWALAYRSLRDALTDAAAHSGTSDPVDEIWVAQGVYKPTNNPLDPTARFDIVAGTSLFGGFAGTETSLDQRDIAAHPTILSGDLAGDDGPDFANTNENSHEILHASGQSIDNGTVIDGFTVTSGHAWRNNPSDRGAGMGIYVAGPVIRNCRFVANWATTGAAAVYVEFGLMPAYPRFEGCVFQGNRSELGGAGAVGISNQADAFVRFTDCQFLSNYAKTTAGALGGAYLTLQRCTFFENVSDDEAGALAIYEEGLVLDCRFLSNRARNFGGAVYTEGDSNTSTLGGNRVKFVNCLFSGNSAFVNDGGAIFIRKSNGIGPTLLDCTIAENSAVRDGGGIHMTIIGASSPNTVLPVVTNCIVYGNSDRTGSGEPAQVYSFGATPTIDFCCVQGWTGGFGGSGNFRFNPRFADPHGCDGIAGTLDDHYALENGSPCVNAGDNYALPGDDLDQDGDGITAEILPLDLDREPRIFQGAVDIGAYESHGGYPIAFCFGDGTGTGTPCPCANSGAPCRGCANSANSAGARLVASGSVLANAGTATDTLVLGASGMPPTASALYLQGSAQVSGGAPFGDGVRCAGGSLKRLALVASVGGSSHYPGPGQLCISARSAQLGDAILGSGLTRYYQTWYRDPLPSFCPNPPGNTWNVTNGLIVSW